MISAGQTVVGGGMSGSFGVQLPTLLPPKDVVAFFDLDGTLTTPVFDLPEGGAYLDEATRFLINKLPVLSDLGHSGVRDGLWRAIEGQVWPNRAKQPFWAHFPNAQGELVRSCPSVDHYLLTQFGARAFLEGFKNEHSPESAAHTQLAAFIASGKWANEMYSAASTAALPYASIDPDAKAVLEDAIKSQWLVSIFTNSSPAKARALAEKAGFGDILVEDRLEKGKLGIIGNGKKALVDTKWADKDQPSSVRFGPTVDVSEFFGEGTVVDLRRRAYYERVSAIMAASGRKQAIMFGDGAVLELLPFANWLEFRPLVGMRTTPMSAPEEVAVASGLLMAPHSPKLSELVVKFK